MGRHSVVEFKCDWPGCPEREPETREARDLGRPIAWNWVGIDKRAPVLLCPTHAGPINEAVIKCERKG